ncbi:hypothetical protein FRB94_010057 [Tulasnella sp. JGI-2019a]|nr:hypothetical protein FRB93_007245 [Tulasnella sp. JGI-2019a]KAG8994207.1 hypothetical protein FRB94_010057 [Tulasnella sp. JGI-2019a]KAG9026691.1 hypothetical protein FRB95_008556 [Tulasnella sp. JGI-2019a]
MPGHRGETREALRHLKSLTKEQRMASAMDRHRMEGEKPTGPRMSIHAIATAYSVPPSSLEHRIKGRNAVGVWTRTKRHLTEAEEVVLVDHIKRLSRRATPATPRVIRECAEAIIRPRKGPDFKLGANRGELQRCPLPLQSRWFQIISSLLTRELSLEMMVMS